MTIGTVPCPTPSRRHSDMRRTAALAALTACVFVVGTSEWVMVGLLPQLAPDLHRPLPTVGSLVTWYALAVTVAGPPVTIGLLRLPRRRALLFLLAVFVVGNLAAASASGFGALLAARVLTALTHSTVFAAALVSAISLSCPAQRGRAIAMVTGGWNLATVLGAPLGTWLGDALGWRTTFWAIAAFGSAILGAVAVLLRPDAPELADRPGGEVRGVLRPRAALVLAVIVTAQGGLFTAYTYIAPLLRQVSGFGDPAVTVLLGLFGLGAVGGNLAGGRLADRAPVAGLRAQLIALAGTLAAFTLTSRVQWAAAATVFTLGVIAACLIPLLQDRAIAAAPEAPTLITAISASAFNLGVAGGSLLGGRALDAGLALHDLPGIGALVAAGPALLSAGLREPRTQPLGIR